MVIATIPVWRTLLELLHYLSLFLGENKEWRNFVNIRIYQWSKMLRYWLVNSTRPVLIVKYEDMKQDPVLQVKRILHFIKYHHLTDEELKIKLKDGFK